jgi:feruloyl esterase
MSLVANRGDGNRGEIFPGFFTSAAGDPGSWPLWITGPAVPGASVQGFFGNAFFGRVIEEIPAPGIWDFSTFDFGQDMKAADRKAEQTFNATDTNLRSFRRQNRNGKIIMWHGWEDPAIPAVSSVDYYEQAVRQNNDANEFLRLFLAPGMTHCGGGPGPNAFGQSLPQAAPLSNAPEHDILSALERWVEGGVAPERIVAVKYVGNQPAQGVERTRPLCAYPKVAVYKGTGSTQNEANFECRRPSRDKDGDGAGD